MAALLATEILFTGVLGFVPSAKDPTLIRVIVPNGRVPNELEEANNIPSHVAYIVFDMDDYVEAADNREPDFTVHAGGREFGAILVKSEFLTIGGEFARAPLKYDTKDFVSADPPKNGDLFSYCDAYEGNPVQLDTRLLQWNPDPERVTMRLNLLHGTFGPVRDSFDAQSTIRDVVRLDLSCTLLAHLAALRLEPTGDVATLTFSSKRVPSGAKLRSLKLARKQSDGDLAVLIGNEPMEDMKASLGFLEPSIRGAHVDHQQRETAPHLLILQRILTSGVMAGLFIPKQIQKDQCVDGFVSQAVYKGPIGKSPTCNPVGFGFGDWDTNETCKIPEFKKK